MYEEWELQPKHGSSNLRIAWHSLSNLLGWCEVRKTVETTLGEARRTAAAAWRGEPGARGVRASGVAAPGRNEAPGRAPGGARPANVQER